MVLTKVQEEYSSQFHVDETGKLIYTPKMPEFLPIPMEFPQFIIVDLFCGAGGTTTGFARAKKKGQHIAKVIACVNHDHKAITSHWKNHPGVHHFEEDIRTLDLSKLVALVEYYRKLFPNAKLILWASLECTNFSKAKGGQPRDADSRTLADHLERYILAIDPDYVQIENVVEFMSWGPLDDKGKPVSKRSGEDFMRWCREICDMGYVNEWKELNSANFGAYTSRNRLFGIFAKPGLPIAWPEATHQKKVEKGRKNYYLQQNMFKQGLQPWKAVKDVLDFEDEGESIFSRKKPLSDKTLERIYAGLIKYVAKGDKSFISKYYSGRPAGKVIPTTGPAGTIATAAGQALVQTSFITQRNGGVPESKLVDVEGPARTLTGTAGNQDLVNAQFLLQTYAANSKGHNTFPVDKPARTITTRDSTQLVFLQHYYSSGGQLSAVDTPAPTIPTKARTAIVKAEFFDDLNSVQKVAVNCNCGNSWTATDPAYLKEPCPKCGGFEGSVTYLDQPEYFIDKHYGKSQNQSIEQPAGTILPTDKHRLVEAVPFIMPTNFDNKPTDIEDPLGTITANRKHHYIVNPSHGGNNSSTEKPCPVIVARQDKAPLYLVQTELSEVAVFVYEDDSEVAVRIKVFMVLYGLGDIKMRMLRVGELLKIQGFPADYVLDGNQSDQKKFIGNSVVPDVVKVWIEALSDRTMMENKKAA